jgi:hypothetical protein
MGAPPGGGGGIPPEILAALGGGGGQQEPQQNPLEVLQDVIQMIPSVMAALPDARDTQDMAKCLQILTGIQTRMMGNGPQGPG